MPQAFDILQYYGEGWDKLFPQCTQEDEYDCMKSLLSRDAANENSICPDSCTETTYATVTKTMSHDFPYMALFELYYQSDRISLYEEYLIFDFPDILAAIGGLLGLFLGFSFFQCGSVILYETGMFLMKMIWRPNSKVFARNIPK